MKYALLFLLLLFSKTGYCAVASNYPDKQMTLGGAHLSSAVTSITNAHPVGIDFSTAQDLDYPKSQFHLYGGASGVSYSVVQTQASLLVENSTVFSEFLSAGDNPVYFYFGNANDIDQTTFTIDATTGFTIGVDGSPALNISNSGELLPANIFNNGGTGGASAQSIASGSYTPTLSNTTNVASSSVIGTGGFRWQRVGNVVNVCGGVNIDTTTGTTNTVLGISLPVASNFSANYQAAGSGSVGAATMMAGRILSNATTDVAEYRFQSDSGATNSAHGLCFNYEVI